MSIEDLQSPERRPCRINHVGLKQVWLQQTSGKHTYNIIQRSLQQPHQYHSPLATQWLEEVAAFHEPLAWVDSNVVFLWQLRHRSLDLALVVRTEDDAPALQFQPGRDFFRLFSQGACLKTVICPEGKIQSLWHSRKLHHPEIAGPRFIGLLSKDYHIGSGSWAARN